VLAVAPRAAAFEREWHVGGGLGGAVAPGYSFGPALNAYGAYGISDAFDVRLELSSSILDRAATATAFYSLKAVFAYKIDVIQWIPWVGVSAGLLGSGKGKWPFESVQPSAGLIAGLDYAWTRHFGLGLCATGDYGFNEAAVYGAGFLRAEYHFGW
jgi:hypothetical protein